MAEGDTARAEKVLERAEKQVPMDVITPNYFTVDMAEAWYRLNRPEKGDSVLMTIANIYDQEMNYHSTLDEAGQNANYQEIGKALQTINECYRTAAKFNRNKIVSDVEKIMSNYQSIFAQFFGRPQQNSRKQKIMQ